MQIGFIIKVCLVRKLRNHHVSCTVSKICQVPDDKKHLEILCDSRCKEFVRNHLANFERVLNHDLSIYSSTYQFSLSKTIEAEIALFAFA